MLSSALATHQFTQLHHSLHHPDSDRVIFVLEKTLKNGDSLLDDIGLIDSPKVWNNGFNHSQLDCRHCLFGAIFASLLDIREK